MGKEGEEKTVKCIGCGGSCREVDREDYLGAKTYLLLECEKCGRNIIVPESKAEKSST